MFFLLRNNLHLNKKRYIKLIEKFGIDEALIHFIVEFEDKYKEYDNFSGRKRTNVLPTRIGRQKLNS